MTIIPSHLSHLFMLSMAALIFHALLWVRNAHFLWSQRRIILTVVLIAELWAVVSDPIGGHWRAWVFNPEKVIGLWFMQVMPLEDFFGMAVVSSASACAVLVFGCSPRRWV
jgi:lycopene cyclase domain-containing protein